MASTPYSPVRPTSLVDQLQREALSVCIDLLGGHATKTATKVSRVTRLNTWALELARVYAKGK